MTDLHRVKTDQKRVKFGCHGQGQRSGKTSLVSRLPAARWQGCRSDSGRHPRRSIHVFSVVAPTLLSTAVRRFSTHASAQGRSCYRPAATHGLAVCTESAPEQLGMHMCTTVATLSQCTPSQSPVGEQLEPEPVENIQLWWTSTDEQVRRHPRLAAMHSET